MDEAPSVSTSMWSIAAAGIWLTSTKFLPFVPAMAWIATRRPLMSTRGGRLLQLRNLPTLVLTNGRRVATHALPGTHGQNLADPNQQPPASTDHLQLPPARTHRTHP